MEFFDLEVKLKYPANVYSSNSQSCKKDKGNKTAAKPLVHY